MKSTMLAPERTVLEAARGWTGRSSRSLLAWSLLVGVLAATLSADAAARGKPEQDEQFCDLSVLVLRQSDGRPVRNAGVVLRPLKRKRSKPGDGFNLKTGKDGRAVMNGIPCGRIRVQVIARRMRTFGGDFQVDQKEQEIVIKLQRPVGQVSAYQ